MQDETVWLSVEQMAELFDRDRTVITRHINNIFKEKELAKNEVCAKFAHSCYKLEKVMIGTKPIMKLVYNVFVFLVNLC